MDNLTLPFTYGKSRLILLPVDPYLMHAYWKISPEELRQANKQAESAQPVLRFYKSANITDEAVDRFDIEIDLRSHNWYVHLWSAEQAYYADLALRQNDGTMIRVVRSKVVRMPRPVPAIAVDQHFMKARTEGEAAQPQIVPAPRPEPQPAPIAPLADVSLPVTREVKPAETPITKQIDSGNIVREKLRELYASVQRLRGSHGTESGTQRPMRKPPPSTGISRIDLSDAAEKKFEAGLSSSSLQRNQPGTSTSRK
jgi:hypothetical protein